MQVYTDNFIRLYIIPNVDKYKEHSHKNIRGNKDISTQKNKRKQGNKLFKNINTEIETDTITKNLKYIHVYRFNHP